MAATQSSRLNCRSQLVRSHGNNVHDVIIAHVISVDAQINIYTNRRGNREVILGPAGRVLRMWPAGNNHAVGIWWSSDSLLQLREKTLLWLYKGREFSTFTRWQLIFSLWIKNIYELCLLKPVTQGINSNVRILITEGEWLPKPLEAPVGD